MAKSSEAAKKVLREKFPELKDEFDRADEITKNRMTEKTSVASVDDADINSTPLPSKSKGTKKEITPREVKKEASSDSNLFYKGGQFTPGGGRAPKGGIYLTPTKAKSIPVYVESSPSSVLTTPPRSTTSAGTEKFYKGGQFIPGGGHAPKGSVYVTPSSKTASTTKATKTVTPPPAPKAAPVPTSTPKPSTTSFL